MLRTTAINTSNTIRTQAGAAEIVIIIIVIIGRLSVRTSDMKLNKSVINDSFGICFILFY